MAARIDKTRSKTVTGRILAVQEDRIRLETGSGQVLLLTLSNRAGAGHAQLQRWQQDGHRLRVTYQGQANLASGSVQAIEPATGEQ